MGAIKSRPWPKLTPIPPGFRSMRPFNLELSAIRDFAYDNQALGHVKELPDTPSRTWCLKNREWHYFMGKKMLPYMKY